MTMTKPHSRSHGASHAHTQITSTHPHCDPHPQKHHWRAVCHFHELEEWRQDNPYIKKHYRRTNNSYTTCLRTLFFLHNETGNVMSHLLGGILFLLFTYYTFAHVVENKWHDQLIFGCFLLCAVGCLMMSGLFHLFSCHSHQVSMAWNKCDYVGIMLMIVGSCYPSIFYSFHCFYHLQTVYLASITIFGVVSVPFLTLDRFTTPEYRVIRTWLFVGMGLSGILPMTHGIYLYSWEVAQQAGGLYWALGMGALYLFGAFLYANQFPEIRWPGKFDLWLHSHQIFHLCVLSAAIVHYIGLTQAYQFHLSHPCHVEPSWHGVES